MVTTRTQLKEQKRRGFDVKPDNSARQFMPYAKAKADSLAYLEDRKKVRDLEEKLADEREAKVLKASGKPPVAPGPTKEDLAQVDANEFQKKLDKLEAEFEAVKPSPGSKARKDELREKINALKG